MKRRLIVLIAVTALLLVGAVPVSAAPGGVPGPPPGHGKAADDAVADDGDEADVKGPPEWAKAYGKRIKDAYGIPYGHLQQCAKAAADDGEAEVDGDDAVADDEEPKKALEACDEEWVFPEEMEGAKAFWVYVETEDLLPVVGM